LSGGDDELIGRISARLLREPDGHGVEGDLVPDWMPDEPFERPPVLAAVLLALVRRPDGLAMLYTERSTRLRSHSGQIAFPGGKIDATDPDAAAAALREAEEEVALDPADARVIGFLPRYFSGTNYLITPVVAEVRPRADFVPNPDEVQAVFEVPLSLLMPTTSYGRFRVSRGSAVHTSWELRHDSRTIWGITANLTRIFRDRALAMEMAE
jgi:8-oxo-dGTP pyrophosphatase MutT (NUDIX family)